MRYRFGDFEFDAGTFQLLKNQQTLALEPKALDVLHLLLERAPDVVDKSEIFSAVWKDVAVTDNSLTRVIARLRKALGDDAREPRYIATVSTRGYRLLPEVTAVDGNFAARRGPEPPVESRSAFAKAPLALTIAVAGLLIIGGTFWIGRSRSVGTVSTTSLSNVDIATLASLTPKEMTAGKGFDGFLSFSPDGATIAYSSDRSGAMEVYVQALTEGSAATPLTTNGRQNVQPVWSPDGQFIAYHEMAGNGIWIVPSGGGAARRVSDFGARPAWSPDGRRIAFQLQSPADLNPGGSFMMTSTIWIVGPDGRSQPVALTRAGEPNGSHGMAAWWPDGRHVLFVAYSQVQRRSSIDLWSVDVETGELRQISKTEKMSGEFAVSPDGRGVYFSARDTHGIWWLPIDDPAIPAGDPKPTGLPVTGTLLSNIVVSRDGRRVGWTAIDASATIWSAPSGPRGGLPAPLVPISEVGWRAGYPTVANDGRVAFIGSLGRQGNQIYLVLPNEPPRQLTTDAPDHGGAMWLDGDRGLAVISDHGDGPAYWRLDPDTGHERLLFRLSDLHQPPGIQSQIRGPGGGLALTRDLSRLAVAYIHDGVPNIWTMMLEAGRPRGQFVQRTFESEGGSYASWSPDGRWIAYECSQGADVNVCVVGADGENRAQLTREEGHSFIGGWVSDNDTLLFAARRNAVWNVTSVSRSSGKARTLTSFTEPRFYVRYPRWDAVNSRVVFERFETAGRLWAVELPRNP